MSPLNTGSSAFPRTMARGCHPTKKELTMTKRVVIENGDGADYDLIVFCGGADTGTTHVVPPNRSLELWIHSGVTITVAEQDSSEESQRLGVRFHEPPAPETETVTSEDVGEMPDDIVG